MRVVIERVPALSAADAAAVRELAAAVTSADGVAPLSEQTLLHLDDASGALHFVLRGTDGRVLGYAQLEDDAAAELLVDPAHRRRGLGRCLLETVVDEPAAAELRVWAHGDGAGARALANRLGFVRSRVLLQLRRPLTGELPEPYVAAWGFGSDLSPGQRRGCVAGRERRSVRDAPGAGPLDARRSGAA